MANWNDGDYDRPIETYPGYLGYFYDGDFIAGPELQRLEDIDLERYRELVVLKGRPRQLDCTIGSGSVAMSFDGDDGIVAILQQLPTVRVELDHGPPDAGPASGGILVFFVAEGFNEAQVWSSIQALVGALESDIQQLEAEFRGAAGAR